MKQIFSKQWKSSIQPRKQRKYRVNAPLHLKRKFLSAHLSDELQKKYHATSLGIRKGDKVKILTGQFKKKEGKILDTDSKKSRVHIENIQLTKKDGSKAFYPIHASNLIITELNMEDKQRKESLNRKNGTSKKTKSA